MPEFTLDPSILLDKKNELHFQTSKIRYGKIIGGHAPIAQKELEKKINYPLTKNKIYTPKIEKIQAFVQAYNALKTAEKPLEKSLLERLKIIIEGYLLLPKSAHQLGQSFAEYLKTTDNYKIRKQALLTLQKNQTCPQEDEKKEVFFWEEMQKLLEDNSDEKWEKVMEIVQKIAQDIDDLRKETPLKTLRNDLQAAAENPPTPALYTLLELLAQPLTTSTQFDPEKKFAPLYLCQHQQTEGVVTLLYLQIAEKTTLHWQEKKEPFNLIFNPKTRQRLDSAQINTGEDFVLINKDKPCQTTEKTFFSQNINPQDAWKITVFAVQWAFEKGLFVQERTETIHVQLPVIPIKDPEIISIINEDSANHTQKKENSVKKKTLPLLFVLKIYPKKTKNLRWNGFPSRSYTKK